MRFTGSGFRLELRRICSEVRYPDCTTFEGLKAMVFKGKVAKELLAAKEIDPHFDDKGGLSPMARFEPTEYGKWLGVQLATRMPEEAACRTWTTLIASLQL